VDAARKSEVRRELDVTDISAAANVGGAEFTTRTIATQVVPRAEDAQRDSGLFVIVVRGEILSCHGHGGCF
jgi:hypothetical protein